MYDRLPCSGGQDNGRSRLPRYNRPLVEAPPTKQPHARPKPNLRNLRFSSLHGRDPDPGARSAAEANPRRPRPPARRAGRQRRRPGRPRRSGRFDSPTGRAVPAGHRRRVQLRQVGFHQRPARPVAPAGGRDADDRPDLPAALRRDGPAPAGRGWRVGADRAGGAAQQDHRRGHAWYECHHARARGADGRVHPPQRPRPLCHLGRPPLHLSLIHISWGSCGRRR